MNHHDAETLWGADAVGRALSCRALPPSPGLLTDIRRAAELEDVDFARWALTLPWPAFCAVVRLVAGVTRAELLTMGEIHE
jgi:hypothetical protein